MSEALYKELIWASVICLGILAITIIACVNAAASMNRNNEE